MYPRFKINVNRANFYELLSFKIVMLHTTLSINDKAKKYQVFIII